jgi:hypothetical protein
MNKTGLIVLALAIVGSRRMGEINNRQNSLYSSTYLSKQLLFCDGEYDGDVLLYNSIVVGTGDSAGSNGAVFNLDNCPIASLHFGSLSYKMSEITPAIMKENGAQAVHGQTGDVGWKWPSSDPTEHNVCGLMCNFRNNRLESISLAVLAPSELRQLGTVKPTRNCTVSLFLTNGRELVMPISRTEMERLLGQPDSERATARPL